MKEFFTNFLAHFSKIVTVGYGLFAVLATLVSEFTGMVNQLTAWAISEIPALVVPSYSINLADYEGILGLVNHFFPLAESWALLVATVPIYIFVATLKFVKQWIPGLG